MNVRETGNLPKDQNVWLVWEIKWTSILLILSLFGILVGCNRTYKSTLPQHLGQKINYSLTFSQIKETPDEYKGKLVILGGKILEAKRRKDSTELTILQLPLVRGREPTQELTRSQGRFIAEQQSFLDPATVPPGTRITLVGEIMGSRTKSLDETEYHYPTLIIKHYRVWNTYPVEDQRYAPRYPYWGPYWGPYPFVYSYWGPGRRGAPFYPYWYGW